MRSFKLPPCPILSFASAADIPVLVTPPATSCSVGLSLAAGDGDDGGEDCFGFHEIPPGLGRGGGGAGEDDCFSNCAMRSRRELTFFGGGEFDSSAMIVVEGVEINNYYVIFDIRFQCNAHERTAWHTPPRETEVAIHAHDPFYLVFSACRSSPGREARS
jgi:hypothetical protein